MMRAAILLGVDAGVGNRDIATNATNVWTVKRVSPQSMVHLTEKPTELAARAMRYSSRQDENVLDLLVGSGSTMIAAEQTGRHAYLMELDALFCDVIVARCEKFSGRKGNAYALRRTSLAASREPSTRFGVASSRSLHRWRGGRAES
jgi:DNA modification methylase